MDQQKIQTNLEAIKELLPLTWKITPKGGKTKWASLLLSLLPSAVCIAVLILSAVFLDHPDGEYGIEITAGTFALVFLSVIFLPKKIYAEYRIDEKGISLNRKKNPLFISWDRAKSYSLTPEGMYYKTFSGIQRMGVRPNEALGASITVQYFTPQKGNSSSVELIPTRFDEQKIISVLRVMLPEKYDVVDFSTNKNKQA